MKAVTSQMRIARGLGVSAVHEIVLAAIDLDDKPTIRWLIGT